MALKTRVERLEKRHNGTAKYSFVAVMQPGETPEDAVTRTLSEEGNMPKQARIIVVPAKNVTKPKGAAA